MRRKTCPIMRATFMSVFLFLFATAPYHARADEAPPGMFMIGPNRTLINIEASTTDVHFVITDPDGLRAGYDHRTEEHYKEFQGSSGSAAERDFSWEIEFNLKDGTYTIEIIGTDQPTWYVMGIRLARKSPMPEHKDIKFEAVVDKDKSNKYQFTFSSDPNKPVGSAARVLTPGYLKNDIVTLRNHHKVGRGGIDNDGIMKSLLAKADAAEAAMARGDNAVAINQLEALMNEVKAQNEKHIDEYGVKILVEDAEYLKKSLQ